MTNSGDTPLSHVAVTDDNGDGFAPYLTEIYRFIPAAGRRDTVYDSKRRLLYISTDAGQVLRYDLARQQFLQPLNLGGSLLGMDISRDQDTLAVADLTAGPSTNRVHVVDLRTNSVRQISFPLAFYEGGTYTVAFAGNSALLVTSTFNGSGWVPLRRVDLNDDSFSTIHSVRQDTMLTRSADGSTIAYAESNISSGPFGRYRVSAGTFTGSTMDWFAFEVGVSRDGSQLAVPSYGGTRIYDSNNNLLATIGTYAGTLPIGQVYSPNSDVVYFAWTGGQHGSIEAYSTRTLTAVATINPQSQFDWNGNGAFGNGRLKVSPDGRWLFTLADGGIQAYGSNDFSSVFKTGDTNGNKLLDPGEVWL